MSAEQNINSQDYELLSAYIDGELSDDERTALERRLAKEAFLQRELDILRTTIALIQYLQPITAPRNFTLTQEMVNESKVIAFKPRRRMQPSYLSLVASILLMLFGVMFMLSEINETQSFSADASAPVQSDSASEKNTAPEVANAPTLVSTGADLQTERTLEEPIILDAIIAEEAEEAPAEDNAVMNLQASSADESVADADAEFRQESFEGDDADTASDGALLSVEASSAVESPASTSAGFADGEAQVFDTASEDDAIEQDVPQPMTGGSFTETEALSDTTTTGNENLDSNDVSDNSIAGARDDESDEGLGRIASTATEIPPSPPQPPTDSRDRSQSSPTQNLNNLQIGMGSLIIGVLLLMLSIMLIRRNRS